MRLVPALGTTAILTALAGTAGAGEPVPLLLASTDLDRITAGAFGGGTVATAGAASDFLAATFTDTGIIVSTDEDPAPGSLQGSVGVTGGTALSWTANGGEPRSADVTTLLGGDGFEVTRLTVGGASQSTITTMETEAVFVLTTVADPIRMRP